MILGSLQNFKQLQGLQLVSASTTTFNSSDILSCDNVDRNMTKMDTSTNFDNSEEAFVWSSFREVLKVWRKGSNEASFNLDIKNGKATLQLNFMLGNPSDPHCDDHCPPQPDGYPHPHLNNHHPHGPADHGRRGRRKGPARIQKDRARAAAFQASKLGAAASAAPTAVTESVPAAVKLPFSGSLLPLKKKIIGGIMQPVPTSTSSVSSLSKPLSASPPPSSYAAAVSTVPAPVKKVGNWKPDVNPESAKKRLFQASHPLPLLTQPEPDQVAPCHDDDVQSRNNFKKKEDELFKKLFT